MPTSNGQTASIAAASLPTSEPCAIGDVPPGGQMTFVVGSRLYGLFDDGSVACLADLGDRSPTWISWSTDGDEVLAGPDLEVRADGSTSDTGYFADNTNVRWSAPTGKALLAPKTATGALIWRNAHNSGERIDVSFADQITSAAYHPDGKDIVATGVGRDGQGPGVFLASNRGANAVRLGTFDEGASANDISFEMSGDSIVFVHQHADGGAHVHRYNLLSQQLDVIAELPDVLPDELIASTVEQGDVAWREARSTVSAQTWVSLGDGSSPVMVPGQPDQVTRPLSWLPGHRLLVASSTPDAATFDLWQWTPAGMTLVIAGVNAASGRVPHGPFNQLNIIQGSGFG